jgi:ketosteroid isomerase-like protein
MDAYNAGDLDEALDFCAVEVRGFPDASVFPEARPFVGRDEFGAFLEETRAAWVASRVIEKEAVDVGNDRVLYRSDWGGQGIASGAETYTNLSHIYTIQDGQITRAEWYFDHDEARKAVGLEE